MVEEKEGGAAAAAMDEMEEPVRLRGKAAIRAIQVKHEESCWVRLYNSYIYTLRLPLPCFVLIMLSTPLLLSFFFTAFYLLDVDGLTIATDHDRWLAATALHLVLGETEFKVFMFSLSLSTGFGGTGVEAMSPYNLVVANLNTMTAQLVFVFLSGAVFHRLSQPAEPVRWAETALITNDKFTEHTDTRVPTPGRKSYKSFIVRVNLADAAKTVLVECKFDIVYRCIRTAEGAPAPFVTQVPLRLVRPAVSYLRFGLVVRHVIDESSPLHGMDLEMFEIQDASFTITMSGTERSSMQPVFSERLYAVADGDVLWDRQYEDQIVTGKHGRTVFSAHALNHLKPLEEDSRVHDMR